MLEIKVKTGQDCPFYTWDNGPQCFFITRYSDEQDEKKLRCALSHQPSEPCPLSLKGGLIVEIEPSESTSKFMEKFGKTK
jgi:hypothetical protein